MPHWSLAVGMFLLLCIFSSGELLAQDGEPTTSYEVMVAPGANAIVKSCDPDENFGYAQDFRASVWTCGVDTAPYNKIRSYISFDLSNIPVGTKIDSARLFLFNNPHSSNPANQGLNEAWLSLITSSWDPYSITWNNRPSVSSEQHVDIPLTLERPLDTVIDVTALTRIALATDYPEFGLELKMQRSGLAFISLGFASGSHDDAQLRPYLLINYSKLASAIEEQPFISDLQISPNPFRSFLEVRLTLEQSTELNIELYDINGRQRYQMQSRHSSGHHRIVCDVPFDLPGGVYLLRVGDADGSTVSRRLVHLQ